MSCFDGLKYFLEKFTNHPLIIRLPYLSYFVTIQPLANFFASCLFDLWALDLVQNSLERMFDTMTPWQLHTPPPTPFFSNNHGYSSTNTATIITTTTTMTSSPIPLPCQLQHNYHFQDFFISTITDNHYYSQIKNVQMRTEDKTKQYCPLSMWLSEIVQYALHYHYFNLENMIWKERSRFI